jgi:hypothetical protein
MGNGETMPFVETVFDESLEFAGFKPVQDMLMD